MRQDNKTENAFIRFNQADIRRQERKERREFLSAICLVLAMAIFSMIATLQLELHYMLNH